MLYPSLSDLLSQVNSRYLLVNIIAQRAREISQRIDETGEDTDIKPVSCAISEIASGSIHVSIDEEI